MSKTETVERTVKPARIRPEHFVINPGDPRAQQRYAVEDNSPLALAFVRGKLASGSRRYSSTDRYSAGVIYQSIWASIHSGGCAAFNPHRVGGGSSEQRASESLCIARDLQKKIEAQMSVDNAFLIRMFVGEGSTGSDAVKERLDGFEKSVWVALCMALDDLADAIVVLGVGRVSRERDG